MRTKGSKDKKKRTHYGGKKIKRRKKSGKFVSYITKRRRGDPLKVMIFEKKIMSYDGYKRWNKKLRPKIKKIVFYPVQIHEGEKPYLLLVDPEDISSVEKIEQLALDVIGYDGSFQLRMPTHRKNKSHCSFCNKADIKIVELENGELKVKVSNYYLMSRYWFWSRK